MIELLKPSIEYKESYIASLREDSGKATPPSDYVDGLEKNFSDFIKSRETLPTGDFEALDGKTYLMDPQHDYWLIKDGEYIGDICLRTSLNSFMETYGGHIGYNIRPSSRKKGYGTLILKELLSFVKEKHDMDRVMIICNPDNIASRKIIEKNGGVFEKTNTYDWSDYQMDVYWVET